METASTGPRRIASIALVACFLVGIWLPLADSLADFAPSAPLAEKRVPAPRPVLPRTAAQTKAFPSGFEAWYDDHFGFRGTLVRAHNILKARGLRMAPSSDVVIGKDGWLYMGIHGAIDQHRAVHPMPPALLEVWRRRFEECHEYCADRGAEFLFVVAPNKVSIYPEFLPNGIERVGDETRLDQLLRYLDEHSDVRILDLRPALLEAKEKELAYRLTDTHWNIVGAFAGYRRLIQELRKATPSIPLFEESDYRRETVHMPGGDITKLMAIPDLYAEDVIELRPRTPFPCREITEGLVAPSIPWATKNDDRMMAGMRTAPFGTVQDDADLPRLVMFRDSFGEDLLAFVSTGFSRAVYYWQYFFDPEIIVAEGPDVVVQQIIERILMRDKLPPNPPKVRVDFERRRQFRAAADELFADPALELVRGAAATSAVGRLRPATPHVPGILRLAVTCAAPTTCTVSIVPDDDPRATGTVLGARSLSAGLEVVYFDVSALAPAHHISIDLSGSEEAVRVDAALRAVPGHE